MKNYKIMCLLTALSVIAAGCNSGGGTAGGSDSPPPPPPPPPPTAANYSVTVTAVDMVNKDSGEALEVEGFPIDGGVLTVD
jgi:hypothetical protein